MHERAVSTGLINSYGNWFQGWLSYGVKVKSKSFSLYLTGIALTLCILDAPPSRSLFLCGKDPLGSGSKQLAHVLIEMIHTNLVIGG